ncbi:MAG TPA: YciI family protein [Aquabacterium sp.]|nr:GTP cyclohydrolase [Burkholderiales bacterium]HET8695368.1 YciI family protein [Aquabacterium sp.]
MLYLILLDYLRPLSEVDAHLEPHRAFLRRHFEAGHFLLSGPKEPRTGGVILARARTEQEVSKWIAEDPFYQQGIARFEVIAWSATMSQPQWPLESIAPV